MKKDQKVFVMPNERIEKGIVARRLADLLKIMAKLPKLNDHARSR
jgi:hypothetical protein